MRTENRIQLSTHRHIAGNVNPIVQFQLSANDNGDAFDAAALANNEHKHWTTALLRDSNSATLQRSLLPIYCHSGGLRPSYNDRTGFYRPPTAAARHLWLIRSPLKTRHVRTLP